MRKCDAREIEERVENINSYTHASVDGRRNLAKEREDRARMIRTIPPIFGNGDERYFYIAKKGGKFYLKEWKEGLIDTKKSLVNYVSKQFAAIYLGLTEYEVDRMISEKRLEYHDNGLELEKLNGIRMFHLDYKKLAEAIC